MLVVLGTSFSITAETYFLQFLASILASRINSKILFCSTRFLDLIFSFCFFNFYQNMIDVGTPFKIQWAPTWDPTSTKWRQIATQIRAIFRPWSCFCSRPIFLETIIITLPFGPTGFEKVTCSMEIGSFSVFLCASFYTTFLSFLFSMIPR